MTDSTTPSAWLWTNPDGSKEVTFVDPARDKSPSTVLALELGRVPVPLAPVDADRAARAGDAEPVYIQSDHLAKARRAPFLCRVHPAKDRQSGMEPLYAAPQAPEREQDDAVLRYLDDLEDDAAVHIFPSDLEKCSRSECVVEVCSVRMGSPAEKSIPLFSREQVTAALAASREGGAS